MPLSKVFNIIPLAEHVDAIKILYMTDRNFKTLWDDYYTSKVNLKKSRERSLEEMRNELEYQQLADDLEAEIITYLNKRSL